MPSMSLPALSRLVYPSACAVGLTLLLTACDRRAPIDTVPAQPTLAASSPSTATIPTTAQRGGGARYDVSKMDYKAPPAVLSGERHTGQFASGNALNMDAAIKPLDPSPVKEIRLDTTLSGLAVARRT